MKEAFYSWVRDIAFYTLLMEIVLHVLPEQSQKKYLQFFMGVVLMILVISPSLEAAGLTGILDETYVRQTYDQELQEFRRRQQEIEKSYEERLQKRVEEAAEELEEKEAETEAPAKEEQDTGENLMQGGVEQIEIPEIKVECGEPEED